MPTNDEITRSTVHIIVFALSNDFMSVTVLALTAPRWTYYSQASLRSYLYFILYLIQCAHLFFKNHSNLIVTPCFGKKVAVKTVKSQGRL